MNTDAFEGSETVAQFLSDTLDNDIASIKRGDRSAFDAADDDMRLKRCGLVYNEGQLTGQRWVSPPGRTYPYIVKVQPLYLAKPTPGLEIEATDGEKYILPRDFKGDWFDVTSPKGVRLIS